MVTSCLVPMDLLTLQNLAASFLMRKRAVSSPFSFLDAMHPFLPHCHSCWGGSGVWTKSCFFLLWSYSFAAPWLLHVHHHWFLRFVWFCPGGTAAPTFASCVSSRFLSGLHLFFKGFPFAEAGFPFAEVFFPLAGVWFPFPEVCFPFAEVDFIAFFIAFASPLLQKQKGCKEGVLISKWLQCNLVLGACFWGFVWFSMWFFIPWACGDKKKHFWWNLMKTMFSSDFIRVCIFYSCPDLSWEFLVWNCSATLLQGSETCTNWRNQQTIIG